MQVTDFAQAPGSKAHKAYERSVLWPVAPQWTTGEVLLGAAYRKVLLGISELKVDRADIDGLPARLRPDEPWGLLLHQPGGLLSPPLDRERGQRQLMPLVPEIARYACVLGRPRNRWDPGNLLLSTIASGLGPNDARRLVSTLGEALRVKPGQDDIFAWFVEASLAALPHEHTQVAAEDLRLRQPAWRQRIVGLRTPAERFAADLQELIVLKEKLTRRQWTVLIEALLRIGLATHVLWLCRLNTCLWEFALRAVGTGIAASDAEILRQGWSGHETEDPLLELGRDGNTTIRNRIQSYLQARIGLNLVLHALDDAGHPWLGEPIGVSNLKAPAEAMSEFVAHIASCRTAVEDVLARATGKASLRAAASFVADRNPRLMNQVSGFPKNIWEFLRHSLMQLKPRDPELSAYDQSYILSRETRAHNSPRPVQPGPAALLLLVHACCTSMEGAPASLDDFKTHLSEYGLRAPAGELQSGQTARDLERLGLVVDSPDAGGGRLLVDPF